MMVILLRGWIKMKTSFQISLSLNTDHMQTLYRKHLRTNSWVVIYPINLLYNTPNFHIQDKINDKNITHEEFETIKYHLDNVDNILSNIKEEIMSTSQTTKKAKKLTTMNISKMKKENWKQTYHLKIIIMNQTITIINNIIHKKIY